MATFVLVPGAYHGGWYFSPILSDLRAAGHNAYTISLSGLGGPSERPQMGINLETHIEDVVSLIELEQLDDIILCGHSYGGMVIAGAADRLGSRVHTLLFLDALVPQNGDSVWSMWAPPTRDMFIEASHDGLVTSAPPNVDPRARAHPLATFLQPITLSAAAYSTLQKIYAWCHTTPDSPFGPIYERLSQDRTWKAKKLNCGHDIINEAPHLALELLLEVANS